MLHLHHLCQGKERWTMYQLKAHFMPQLYWFGLIKVRLARELVLVCYFMVLGYMLMKSM